MHTWMKDNYIKTLEAKVEELTELAQELSGQLGDAVDWMEPFTLGGMSHANFGCACGYDWGDEDVEECICEDLDEHPFIASKRQLLEKVDQLLGRR